MANQLSEAEKFVNQLAEAYSDVDAEPQRMQAKAATEALVPLGDAAVQAIARQKEGLPTDAKVQVIAILGRIGSPSARQLLNSLLDDASQAVRTAATEELTRLRDAKAVDKLLLALESRHVQTQVDAVHALAKMGVGAAITPLERIAESGHPLLAKEAHTAIIQITGGIPALAKVAHDPQRPPEDRRSALGALGASDQPAAVSPLLEAAASPDESIRFGAINALNNLCYSVALSDAERQKVVGVMVQVLHRDKSDRCRVYAASVLGAIRDKQAITALKRASQNDPYARVREIASRVLEI
jgi:HEAT repeat protein